MSDPRGVPAPAACANRGCPGTPRHRGLCNSCYHYEWKRGRPRPRYLWAEECINCKRPRTGPSSLRSYGRCDTCRRYLQRYGKERAPDIIRRHAPLGWCDCGAPAVEEQQIVTRPHLAQRESGRVSRHTLRLCADCASVERHMQRHNSAV